MPQRRLAALADTVRAVGAYDLIEPLHSAVRVRRWEAAGRPIPPPSAVKRAVLREYARGYGLRTLVETGTFKADTVRALRREFDTIYSIELDPALHRQARRRCRRQRNAELRRGDSTDLLPEIMGELTGPALFWLDAHYSGGLTGTGALETPIMQELAAITSDRRHQHVILVDDHREFLQGQVDYPGEAEVRDVAAAAGYELTASDDILRLLPAPAVEVR